MISDMLRRVAYLTHTITHNIERVHPQTLAYDMHRFGLTPGKICARLISACNHKILYISIPKSGTHLVERALSLHPSLHRALYPTLHPGNIERWGGLGHVLNSLGRGKFLVTHLPYSEYVSAIPSNVKVLFSIRDPREIVVSDAKYILSKKNHRLHQIAKDMGIGLHSLIRLLLSGSDEINLRPAAHVFSRFVRWMDEADCVIRFEEVRDPDTRAEALAYMYSSLGISADLQHVRHSSSMVVDSRSPTFRSSVLPHFQDLPSNIQDDMWEHLAEWCRLFGYERSPGKRRHENQPK